MAQLRYHHTTSRSVRSQRTDDFLNAIVSVYRKFGLALGTENQQSAFIVQPNSKKSETWLLDAMISDLEKI